MSDRPPLSNPSRRRIAILAVACVLGSAAVAHAGRGPNRVQKIEAREDGGQTIVAIRGTATPTFTVYKLERPERVVIDVANATLGAALAGPVDVNTWAVGQISAQTLGDDEAQVARVIIGFARPATYRVRAVGDDVIVTITPREAKPETPDTSAERAELQRKGEEAERARLEAERAREAAERAKREAEVARAEAERAREAAEAREAEAKKRIGEADRRMAEAEGRIREADAAKASAEKARREAERAVAEADKKRHEAEDAAKRAESVVAQAKARQEEAERAAAEAKQRAAEAEESGAEDAARKRQEAEAAAAVAEKRRREAEAAAAQAEKRRRDAEEKRAQAEEKRVQADTKRQDAEAAAERAVAAKRDAVEEKQRAEVARDEATRERDAAEKARAEAERARKQAEEARKQAEEARKREEERARVVAKKRIEEEARAEAVAAKRAEEEARTRAAADARAREEAAAAEAEEARERAEGRRAEAERALAAVEESRGRADAARAEAERRRQEAEEAAQAAERVARQKGAESAEAKKARAEAERMEAKRRAAEEELAARKKQLAADEAAAKRVGAARDRAVAEAADAREGAEKARRAREQEEQKRARIEAERIAEEKRLAEAKRKRVEEEQRLAEAEEKRAEAEKKRAEAEKKRAEAEAAARVARAEAEAAAAVPAPVAKRPEPAPALAPAPAPKKKPAAVAASGVRVRDVDFVDRDDAARVVLDLSGPAKPKVLAASGKQAILEISGVEIPAELERSLDVSEFSGPVTAVSSYRDPRSPEKVRIVVDLAEPATSELKRSGNTWYWDFQKPVAARKKKKPATPATPAPRTTTYDPPVVGGYGATSTPVTSQTVAQRKKKIYRGPKISLEYKDADIHNVLRALALVGRVSIVVPDEIKGTVTIRLVDVPWDQALEVILQSKGLWYRQEGNLIRVATRKELDAEDEEERARKRALVQEEQPEPVIFTLNYAVAEDMAKQVRPLLSPKGKIEVDPRTNSLIINDVKGNRTRIIDLLTQLDTQTPQIQIEARIVEARSTFVREIGVQWGVGAIASTTTGNATGLIFPSTIGMFGGGMDQQTNARGIVGSPDFAVNLPAAVGQGQGGAMGFTFGSVGGNFNLTLRLSAMEDQGSVRIISAPKITVLNNIEASISQGVSIPISVVSAQGVQTQFVPADLKLTVTPHVSQRDCSIQLEVEVTKNEADFVNTGARGDPTILRKEAKTTLILADGETTVIGGIYTRNTGLSYSKVPYLAEIPVLGWFFRSRRENDERTEVLIFLTPKITNKASLRCEARPR